MASGELIEAGQMCESGGPNLTPIRPLAAVAHKEYSHFAFGSFYCGVCLTRRYSVSFGKEKEVVNQCLHVFLHSCTGRRTDFIVFDSNWSGRYFVQALVDNA